MVWYLLWDCPRTGKKSCWNICKWCEHQTTCPTLPPPEKRAIPFCDAECVYNCGDDPAFYLGLKDLYEYLVGETKRR